MSGYLELKYPFKSNLGLNPFKSWKRQWCILRPSPTFSGGILAVYCSEAGVAGACAGTVELPSGFVVRRAKSRSRPHAFAVFPRDEPRKPRVLLAAASLLDAHAWMDKISALISGQKLMDSEGSLKDSYSVSVNITEFSRKCGLSGSDSTVTVSPAGVLVSRTQQLGLFMEWRHINEAVLSMESDIHGICVVTVDRDFQGGGSLHFSSPLAADLTAALSRVLTVHHPFSKKLSKSDGDLRTPKCNDSDIGDDVQRSSWYSGPSEVSLDHLDLVMSKDCKHIPEGQLSRSTAADDLAPAPLMDDSMSDRRSLVSIASGIYEEIPDVPPAPVEDNVYCKMSRDASFIKCRQLETMSLRLCPEPMYECVADCIYGTLRRPPPLPPRTTHRSASVWGGVTRHSSLGALPAPAPAPPPAARTLPRWDRSRQAFSAFRKRLKSDSRTAVSPKSETSKDKDVETKKKKFDFTPTRHIFKSFKVSRKMKDLKITSNGLGKESKSCEFLDETEHVKTNRCSKSVECLDGTDEYDGFDADLSIEFNDDTVTALSLPQEIVHLLLDSQKILNSEILNEDMSLHLNGDVELILNSHEKVLKSDILNDDLDLHLNGEVEGDYMPMSPIVPPQANLEHHYIVMSPRSNIA